MPGFPPWFPVEAGFVLLAVLITAALLMNRGNWWFINVLAMDEPVLVAIGVAAAFVGFQNSMALVIAAGAAVAAVGVVSRYTNLLDVDSVVGGLGD